MDYRQFDVKNDDFRDYNGFSPKYSLKTWFPWQQGIVYTHHFDFKISPKRVWEMSQSFLIKSLTTSEIFIKNLQGG